jgi:hypothetical protein
LIADRPNSSSYTSKTIDPAVVYLGVEPAV